MLPTVAKFYFCIVYVNARAQARVSPWIFHIFISFRFAEFCLFFYINCFYLVSKAADSLY